MSGAIFYIGNDRLEIEHLKIWIGSPKSPQWQEDIADFLRRWYDENDYIEVHTSGSTAKPKSIRLSKNSMKASAKKTAEYFILPQAASALLCLPSKYIAGQMMIVRALVNGWKLQCVEPSTIPLKELNGRVDFAAMVPMQFEKCLVENPEELEKIETIILGGAPISIGLREKIYAMSSRVFLTYGMTETATHVAVQVIEKGNEDFTAIPGFRFSTDIRSCLKIESAHLDQKLIATNDVVRIINETNFRWLGRADNVINSGGIKFHPEVLENKISAFILPEIYIGKKADDTLGESIVLVIEAEEKEIDRQELMSMLRSKLDKHEMPREIIFQPTFARTNTGKIIREI